MNKVHFLIFISFLICLETFGQTTSLCDLDKSKMIPLRDAKYRAYPFVAKLKGSAISLDSPYEILYDTGSWTTSIPGGALNLTKIKILKENVNDPWGNLADLVSGQLILESVDGTPYELNDYVFYATKDKITKNYLPDDRQSIYGTGSILGAFPSIDPFTKLPSLAFALASKYAPNDMGLGIISNCLEDIDKNWNSMKSYLQIGNNSKISDKLNFRTDIPNWRNQKEFHPEAVPGFKIKIKFSDTDKIIETSNLISTVDTGAPELTLRLGSNDPQNQASFSSHFIKDGAWVNWNNPDYNNSAKTLINADVTIEFIDSNGTNNSYTYPVNDNAFSTPNTLYSCTWEGNAPWKESLPQFPKNRINLGNTIYFYCPVYFWDIKNKRVGIGFKNSSLPPCNNLCLPITTKIVKETPCENNVVYPTVDNLVTLESYGLDGRVINKLDATQTTLIAATDDGVYYKEFSQNCWNYSNLKSKNVQTIVRINSSTLICSTTQALDNISSPQLYKSTDNGKTWSLLPNNFTENDGQFVNSFGYNSNSNTLYAGGNGVIASSTDGGSNWTLLYGQWDAISRPFSGLAINLTNNEIWAGGQNGLEMQVVVHLAQDGKILNQWANLIPAPSTVEKIIIKNGTSTTLLMGSEDGILKSNDNGLNWGNIYDVPNQYGRFYYGLVYDEMKPNRIIAASWDKNFDFPQPLILHFSEDNGQTWKIVTTEGISNFESLFGGTRTIVQRNENGKTVLYLGLWKGGVYKAIIES